MRPRLSISYRDRLTGASLSPPADMYLDDELIKSSIYSSTGYVSSRCILALIRAARGLRHAFEFTAARLSRSDLHFALLYYCVTLIKPRDKRSRSFYAAESEAAIFMGGLSIDVDGVLINRPVSACRDRPMHGSRTQLSRIVDAQ